MPAMAMPTDTHNPDWRVGVDTGGTFTDVLLADPAGIGCFRHGEKHGSDRSAVSAGIAQ